MIMGIRIQNIMKFRQTPESEVIDDTRSESEPSQMRLLEKNECIARFAII